MSRKLIIVSGPPGAGKSTTARVIATSLDRSLHIECDNLYNIVIGGHKKPWEDTGKELLKLMYLTVAKQSEIYINADFDVVLDYVWDIDDLSLFLSNFKNRRVEVKVIFLLPNSDVLVARDKNRKWTVGKERVHLYHDQFTILKNSALRSMFVDNSKTQSSSESDMGSEFFTIDSLLEILGKCHHKGD